MNDWHNFAVNVGNESRDSIINLLRFLEVKEGQEETGSDRVNNMSDYPCDGHVYALSVRVAPNAWI